MWEAGVRVESGRYQLTQNIERAAHIELWEAVGVAPDSLPHAWIKRLLPVEGDTPSKRRILRQEVQQTAALEHPNIAQIAEIGEEDLCLYLVSPQMTGEDLETSLRYQLATRGQGLPWEQVIKVGLAVCDGLAYAHGLCDDTGSPTPLFHGELKPARLWQTDEGVIKILDFGLSGTSDFATRADGSNADAVAYMAPEQVRGDALDHRSDLFCLGAVLYALLAGVAPFRAKSFSKTLTAILKDYPPSFTRRDLPDGLEQIIFWMLEKNPEDRPQNAKQVRQALAFYESTKEAEEAEAEAAEAAEAAAKPLDTDPASTGSPARSASHADTGDDLRPARETHDTNEEVLPREAYTPAEQAEVSAMHRASEEAASSSSQQDRAAGGSALAWESPDMPWEEVSQSTAVLVESTLDDPPVAFAAQSYEVHPEDSFAEHLGPAFILPSEPVEAPRYETPSGVRRVVVPSKEPPSPHWTPTRLPPAPGDSAAYESPTSTFMRDPVAESLLPPPGGRSSRRPNPAEETVELPPDPNARARHHALPPPPRRRPYAHAHEETMMLEERERLQALQDEPISLDWHLPPTDQPHPEAPFDEAPLDDAPDEAPSYAPLSIEQEALFRSPLQRSLTRKTKQRLVMLMGIFGVGIVLWGWWLLPARVEILLQSHPSALVHNAKGQLLGTTPLRIQGKEGQHLSFRLQLSGYHSRSISILLTKERKQQRTFQLQRADLPPLPSLRSP